MQGTPAVQHGGKQKMTCKDQSTADRSYAFTRIGFQVCDPQGRDVIKLAEKEHFSVTRVAEELGLSIHQFKAYFERTVGLCPKEFFRHYRAVKARRMISESIPLVEIAEQLGFRYYTHFAAEIRSFYGISPRDLQRLVMPSTMPLGRGKKDKTAVEGSLRVTTAVRSTTHLPAATRPAYNRA
jgi:AraC-like DNA-binding protein